jgi:hypothetical protein
MAMSVFSSPATLTGVEEKKTGPSRFIVDFSSVTLDSIGKNTTQVSREEHEASKQEYYNINRRRFGGPPLECAGMIAVWCG